MNLYPEKENHKEHKITLIECRDYTFDRVDHAIRATLEPLGGMGRFIKPGQRVALKPNLLRRVGASSAVVTHPLIVEVVAKIVLEVGGSPFVIDSPGTGIPFTAKTLKRNYEKNGYLEMDPAIELNYDTDFKSVSFPEGGILKRFEILKPILDADRIINLPKVKAHGFTYLSCGVKNLFGVVPGLHKSAYHSKFQDQESFGRMLIDLNRLLNPRLTICDGIIGMEGDGPSWGKPKMLGIIATSENPFILDFVISHIIGFDPLDVYYLKHAIREGLCPENLSDIVLVPPQRIASFHVPFDPPTSFIHRRLFDKLKQMFLLKFVCRFFENILCVKLVINDSLCHRCGLCAESCPKKAITISANRARIDYKKCIRCFCCHELCPYGSVFLKRTILNRIFQNNA